MAEDAQLAESSPAEPTIPDIDTFSADQRQEWLMKGTPFESPKAESTPAPEPSAAPEKTAETAAAPEAAPTQGKKGNAESRIQELLDDRHTLRTDNEALRTRLEALEKGDQKTAASPPADSAKPAEAKPVKPNIDTFEGTYGEYQAALTKYEEAHEAWLMAETRKTVERELTTKQRQEADKKAWDEALKTHGAEFPEWMRTVAANSPEGLQFAVSSLDNWAGVAAHLAKNPEQLKAVAEKFAINQIAAIAELGRIEASLSAPKEPQKAPVEIRTTKAPPPITDIAGRNAAPPDELRAAIEAGDAGFTRYRELANARDMKKRA